MLGLEISYRAVLKEKIFFDILIGVYADGSVFKGWKNG
jgi:hypothetical protein